MGFVGPMTAENVDAPRAIEPWLAGAIAEPLPALPVGTPCGRVYADIVVRPEHHALAIVDRSARPIGLLNRFNLLARWSRPYVPELFERKSIKIGRAHV